MESLNLLDRLKNIQINGDKHRLALVSLAYQAIYQLGDLEHTSDWDPYIELTLDTGETIESESHSADFDFGDLSIEEQKTAIEHIDELTNIVVQLPEDQPHPNIEGIVVQASDLGYDHEAIIPISRIQTITYYR